MTHNDRRNIGLEQVLTEYISALTDADDIPLNELEAQITEMSPVLRHTLDSMIRTGLRIFRGKYPHAYPLIPDEFKEHFSKEPARSDPGRILAFLKWFLDLRTANRQARVERGARLNDLCANISRAESECSAARNFFGLNNQRVILRQCSGGGGTDLILGSAEREWGRVLFRFSDCSCFEPRLLPLPGYLYCFDGGILPSGGFTVSLLVDTGFGNENYPARLLSDTGWKEFSFECRGISAEPVFYDYAGRMRRLGTPRAELIERCCSLLISKYDLLGRDCLTEGEKGLLPAAELLNGSAGLLRGDDPDSEDRFRLLIARALDNRYAMRRFCSLLDNCGCEKLKNTLEAALELFDGDDPDAAVLRAEEFRGQLATATADGSARPLLSELAEQFVMMTSSLSDDPYRCAAELQITDRVREAAVPELERMGFTGSYPHYWRAGAKHTDYISFMLCTGGDKPQQGIISYYASIAAARLSVSQSSALEKKGLPREKANALDCTPEEIGLTRYGELAGAHDLSYIRMDMNVYDGGKLVFDDSSLLPRYLRAADMQFSRGTLPLWYRRLRRKAGAPKGAHLRSLAACSPIGVITAAVMMLFLYFRGDSESLAILDRGQLIAAALSGGFAVNVIAAVIRDLFLSFRLWRY